MDQYLGQAATLSEATLQLAKVFQEVGGGNLMGNPGGLDVQGDQVAEIKVLLDSKVYFSLFLNSTV